MIKIVAGLALAMSAAAVPVPSRRRLQGNMVNHGITGCTPTRKCSLCHGDCDRDADCLTGLQCYQRNGMQAIPGCAPGGRSDVRGYDFCYAAGSVNANLMHRNIVNLGISGCSTSKRCALCEGDCDNDRQCMPGLECFQRNDKRPVPGCLMNNHNNINAYDFCITPTQGATNHLIRHNLLNKGWSGCTPSRKCGVCQGDCDRDSDCMYGLKCFVRNALQPVPGCNTAGRHNVKDVDFCITPTQGSSLTHRNGCAASITNYVTFKGVRYATIENNPVDGSSRGCQDGRYLPLPPGYTVASDTYDVRYNVIAKHKWSTDCPITASGNAYKSSDQGGGGSCGINELKTRRSGYHMTYGIRPGCARRVLIQCRGH